MGLLAQIYENRWLLALATLTFYAVGKIRTYNRLKQFKGPFGTGFSELWHTRAILSLQSHLKYRDVSDKYGKMHSQLSWVVYSDLRAQERSLGSAPTTWSRRRPSCSPT